jgi:hypothetical protein
MNALRYHALWDGSNTCSDSFWDLAAVAAPLLTRPVSRYIRAMAEKFRCTLCDQEESRCQCDKYCFMCQGGHDVRLCQDGMYYCQECREACDLQPQP